MNPGPVGPAHAGGAAGGAPRSPGHDEGPRTYPDAEAQASQAFLEGHGLPGRWQGRERFVVLDTRFGGGTRFLAVWQAWRADPQRCERLVYLAVDTLTPHRNEPTAMPQDNPTPALAAALAAAWPVATPDLHCLDFDAGRVRLLLARGELSAWLPALHAEVDAFFLAGTPAQPPGAWDPRLFQTLARIAAPGATAAGTGTDPGLPARLAGAGFHVGPGSAGTQARFEPRFVPKRPPARRAAPAAALAERHALVVGAGLAGCATVAALAAQGWRTTLVDRGHDLASEASGNPAGLFHGVVHAEDGPHARFHRACALHAHRVISALLAGSSTVAQAGAAGGLLRLETSLEIEAMHALLARLGLPATHVQALDAEAASALAGLPLHSPAWLHHAGGWVRPAWLARRWREAAGEACRFVGGATATALRRQSGGWDLVDAQGATLASAPVLVLANACGAAGLLQTLGLPDGACPLSRTRGQISVLSPDPAHPLPSPLRPVVGSGYLLPAVDGRLVFGATSQADDEDGSVRDSDHHENLHRLAQLSPAYADLGRMSVDALQGRTGFRCVSRDRLPLIGAVPDAWVGGPDDGWDQPRFVPRVPGLYLCTGLGSRGITVAALGAELLAATLTGAPLPLGSDLVDAVDPARFLTRATRRRAAGRQANGTEG